PTVLILTYNRSCHESLRLSRPSSRSVKLGFHWSAIWGSTVRVYLASGVSFLWRRSLCNVSFPGLLLLASYWPYDLKPLEPADRHTRSHCTSIFWENTDSKFQDLAALCTSVRWEPVPLSRIRQFATGQTEESNFPWT
ncbi:hypothetical protein EDD17DRAFT_1900122, partial [Pisolithus thermaeus]